MADGIARPVDRVVGGYLLLSAAALAFPHRPAGWPVLALLHLVVAAVLLAGLPDRLRTGSTGTWSIPGTGAGDGGRAGGGRAAARRTDGGRPHPVVAWLTDWYPLIMIPVVYLELQVLNRAVWGGRYFDATIMGWEEALFGGQPSVTWAAQWDSLLGSELLHLAYLSYYFVVYLFPLWLYLAGRRDAFHRTVFAIMLGFAVHYMFFVYFPVQGPRYLFPGPGGSQTEGVLYELTRTLLEGGSSRGAAFPSSHVGLAAVQTVSAARYAPKAAPLLGVLTVGIALGAVYGGFHYAVDVTAGLVAGVLLGLVAPAVWRLLR
ncbi:MAG: phosphatase PAP2 family protein [Candidatus Longimicrobiales bacterium M2_2A_002]